MNDLPLWTLEEARVLLRSIEPHLKAVGYTAALTGSVLRDGASSNDLDLIIYPYSTDSAVVEELYLALTNLGWRRWLTCEQVHTFWRKQGSTDEKHVECWFAPGRKRIDLFLLR